MGALLIVAALAAQAGTAGGSTPPASTDTTAPQIHPGETSYVDLEGGVGYSTNPQLSLATDQGSAFGRVSQQLLAIRRRCTTVVMGCL